MRVFLVSLVFLVSSVSSLYVNLTDQLWNMEFWYVPGADLTYTLVSQGTVLREIASLQLLDDPVRFYLYTQDNPTAGQKLDTSNEESFTSSSLNTRNPTRIIIHGYQSDSDQPVCTSIRDALLAKQPSNVICVDWREIAGSTYPTARFSLPRVAEMVGTLISNLTQDDLKIMGHGLGAHVAGYVGKSVPGIKHIIGLDPVHELFSYDDCESRLCNTDAEFVESVQTSAGRWGFYEPIGVLAFFPNGGLEQPACESDPTGACAHNISCDYYAEAIENDDFPTYQCGESVARAPRDCAKTFSDVRMGSDSSYGLRGNYFVPVNSEPPYGKGVQSE